MEAAGYLFLFLSHVPEYEVLPLGTTDHQPQVAEQCGESSLPLWAGESEIDLANRLIILFADGEIMMIDAHSRPPVDVQIDPAILAPWQNHLVEI